MELSALGSSTSVSNILKFLKTLPACAKTHNISFSTTPKFVESVKPVDLLAMSGT